MTAISPTTHAQIKAYLEVFIENLVERYKKRSFERLGKPGDYLSRKPSRAERKLRPFHAAIIPPELRRVSAFERGFSTSLGSTFEECARLIALEHHQEAHRNHALTGMVSRAAINEIEHQVARFEQAAESEGKAPRPSLEQMINAVLRARRDDDREERTVRADLYILAKNGIEYFFEMKSPDPNKGQCLEVTQRILRFHLVRGQPRPTMVAYFAMAYNPDGPSREDYGWSIARSYLPFEQAVIIGHEFWDLVGGPTAYEELLTVYHEVGRDKAKHLIDSLAFGF